MSVWAIPSSSQGLFLALCSAVTMTVLRVMYMMMGTNGFMECVHTCDFHGFYSQLEIWTFQQGILGY